MYIGLFFYEIINYIRTSFEELLELNETILDGLLAAADKRIIKIKQKISELSDEGEKS